MNLCLFLNAARRVSALLPVTVCLLCLSRGTAQEEKRSIWAPWPELTPPDHPSTSSERVNSDSPAPAPASASVRGPVPLPATAATPIFFPPNVPILDAVIQERAATARDAKGKSLAAPEGLADYVNECFYPELGARLYNHSLSKKLEERIETYRRARNSLVAEIQDQLNSLQKADRPVRERTLQDFAAKQTPRIVALEDEAEGIRDALLKSGLFDKSVDWDAARRKAKQFPVTIGGPLIPETAQAEMAEYDLLRSVLYFQNGLSAEQRELVSELAKELLLARRRAAFARARFQNPDNDPTAMFFSPATARLHVPTGLPPELTAKIGAYARDKNELKRELREVIIAQDAASTTVRTKAYETLAESQRPRLVALAKSAEEIRHDLAVLPPSASVLGPRLPAELGHRLEAYRNDRRALQEEQIDRTTAAFRQAHSRYRPGDSVTAKIDEATEAFQRENRGRYDELNERANAIRRDLVAFADTQTDPKTGRPMDAAALLKSLDEAGARFEALAREETMYRDYKAAVLEPGLSPEQRRLLFNAALAGLALPLPPGEIRPGQVSDFPLM